MLLSIVFLKSFFHKRGKSPTISGVGLTSMIVGLDNRSFSAIITNTLMGAANTALNGVNIPQDVLDKALLFGLSSLQKASLESALTTLALIKDQLNPDNLASTGAKIALATVNLNVIQNLINSNAIDEALSSFLEAGI